MYECVQCIVHDGKTLRIRFIFFKQLLRKPSLNNRKSEQMERTCGEHRSVTNLFFLFSCSDKGSLIRIITAFPFYADVAQPAEMVPAFSVFILEF